MLETAAMHCRCPHCHNPIEIVAEDSLHQIECPSCGSHFELVDAQSTASYHPTPRLSLLSPREVPDIAGRPSRESGSYAVKQFAAVDGGAV